MFSIHKNIHHKNEKIIIIIKKKNKKDFRLPDFAARRSQSRIIVANKGDGRLPEKNKIWRSDLQRIVKRLLSCLFMCSFVKFQFDWK